MEKAEQLKAERRARDKTRAKQERIMSTKLLAGVAVTLAAWTYFCVMLLDALAAAAW